jgi:hypothetical protein
VLASLVHFSSSSVVASLLPDLCGKEGMGMDMLFEFPFSPRLRLLQLAPHQSLNAPGMLFVGQLSFRTFSEELTILSSLDVDASGST